MINSTPELFLNMVSPTKGDKIEDVGTEASDAHLLE
jgi:hypothetical protein